MPDVKTLTQGTILARMVDLFETCVPPDDYLATNDEVACAVRHVRYLLADPMATTSQRLEALYAFNRDWLPDSLDDVERDEQYDLLDQAVRLL